VPLDRVFIEGFLPEHCPHVVCGCIALVFEPVPFLMGDKPNAHHAVWFSVNVGCKVSRAEELKEAFVADGSPPEAGRLPDHVHGSHGVPTFRELGREVV
jgi:hypothetical protein